MTTDGKDFGKAIGEKIGASLKRMKEESEKNLEESLAPPQEDLNILPMPDDQEIHKDWIEWTWIINPPSMNIRVNGVLYTHDVDYKSAGQYIVDIDLGDTEPQKKKANIFTADVGDTEPQKKKANIFTADVAKQIGIATISAANWIKVWQQHFGHLFAKKNIQVSVTEFNPDDE